MLFQTADHGPLIVKRGGKTQIRSDIKRLLEEWRDWCEVVKDLPTSPDYSQSCTEAVKDGYLHISRHEKLREKTLVFLRNTFSGYEFILDKWPSHPHEDHVYSRLSRRVPAWIERLEMLNDALDYAIVSTAQANPVEILNVDFWERIHPKVTSVARQRFESAQFADAVEAALKELSQLVKQTVEGIVPPALDGAALMNRVFSKENPLFIFDDLSTESGKNIQQGYMQIFAGVMIGIRNPKAHANLEIDENRAVHFLFLASLLLFKMDEGKLAENHVGSTQPINSGEANT